MHHFIAISETKLELQSGNAQFGSKSANFCFTATLKFDRWHWKIIGWLFYATSSYVCHFVANYEFKMVMVRKHLNWVKICFDLRDLDLWYLTLTFCMNMALSMVITTENFRMVRWQEHCQKVWRTDGQRDERTDRGKEVFLELLGRSWNLTCDADKKTNTTQSTREEKSLPAQSNYIYWDSTEPVACAKQTNKTYS